MNFCNLNKNTVKNIQARERQQECNEDELRESVGNKKIELVGQYYLVDYDSSSKNEDEKDNTNQW